MDGEGKHLRLCIGKRPGAVNFDSEALLVRKDVALAQKAAVSTSRSSGISGSGKSSYASGEERGTGGGTRGSSDSETPPAKRPTRFYGSVKLNALKLGSGAAEIGDEVVKHLAGLVGSNVEVVLEVRARVPDGIPEKVERDVSENARSLKFQTFEFEEE